MPTKNPPSDNNESRENAPEETAGKLKESTDLSLLNAAGGVRKPPGNHSTLAEMEPLRGKTYSLCTNGLSSSLYYQTVRALADACLREQPDLPRLVGEIRSAAQSSKRLRAVLGHPREHPSVSRVLETIRGPLSCYITGLAEHLASISLLKRFDPVLSMKEEQYLLAMLEIELMNRLHREEFLRTRYRIALLPHCLRDLNRTCNSAMADLDYVCRRCSDDCYIHRASDILAHNRVGLTSG